MALVLDPLSPMLDLIVLSAVQMVRDDAGAVALLGEGGASLRVRASRGLSGAALARLHPTHDASIRGALGRVGLTVPVTWSDGQPDDAWQVVALPLGGDAERH